MAIGFTDLVFLILVAGAGLSVIAGMIYITITLIKKMMAN
jgi:hypothetical protein